MLTAQIEIHDLYSFMSNFETPIWQDHKFFKIPHIGIFFEICFQGKGGRDAAPEQKGTESLDAGRDPPRRQEWEISR